MLAKNTDWETIVNECVIKLTQLTYYEKCVGHAVTSCVQQSFLWSPLTNKPFKQGSILCPEVRNGYQGRLILKMEARSPTTA